MRIIIKNSATGEETTLCDGATRDVDKSSGPVEIAMSAPGVVDPQGATRATEMKVRERGNVSTRITFQVLRRCSDDQAATAWLALHLATVVRKDTLIMLADSGIGKTVTITVPYVAMEEPAGRQMGASVMLTYKLSGGRMIVQ